MGEVVEEVVKTEEPKAAVDNKEKVSGERYVILVTDGTEAWIGKNTLTSPLELLKLLELAHSGVSQAMNKARLENEAARETSTDKKPKLVISK